MFQAYSVLKIGKGLAYSSLGYLKETDIGYLLARWYYDFNRSEDTKKQLKKYLSRNIKDAFNRSLYALEKHIDKKDLSTTDEKEYETLYKDDKICFDRYLSCDGFYYELFFLIENTIIMLLFTEYDHSMEKPILGKIEHYKDYYGKKEYVMKLIDYFLRKSSKNGEIIYRKNNEIIKKTATSGLQKPDSNITCDVIYYRFQLSSPID